MKTQNLLANIAAALITAASLHAVTRNYAPMPMHATSSTIDGSKITNLPTIDVHPTSEERRAADLLPAMAVLGTIALPTSDNLGASGEAGRFTLASSQWVMPYYSFGHEFGRISKE
jgi:hypothetical protein